MCGAQRSIPGAFHLLATMAWAGKEWLEINVEPAYGT